MDEQSLEAHLAELFEERGYIDPYIAMHFNHHQWQANGKTTTPTAHSTPAAWDLHDEADDKALSEGKQPPYGGRKTKKPRWKLLEERADREKAEAARPKPVQCSNSGGWGYLEFRDGMEDWYVHCPACGVTWMGGNDDPLPVHNRPLGS